jgi:hypothetical protein
MWSMFARRFAHPRYCRSLAALACGAFSVGLAAPAAAQQLPPNNAGTGQYVEPVPDSAGDRPGAPGAGPDRGSLPPSTRDQLPGGGEGRILERLVGDPGSGAQPDAVEGDGSKARSGLGRSAIPDRAPSAVSAAKEAALDSDTPSVAIVLLGVLALTAGVTVARTLARRRRGAP